MTLLDDNKKEQNDRVSQWSVGKFLNVQPVVTGQWGISRLADRWLVAYIASSLCAPLAASFQWDPNFLRNKYEHLLKCKLRGQF